MTIDDVLNVAQYTYASPSTNSTATSIVDFGDTDDKLRLTPEISGGGENVGADDGTDDGRDVGEEEGVNVGDFDGITVGATVGADEGERVGTVLGFAVEGTAVG